VTAGVAPALPQGARSLLVGRGDAMALRSAGQLPDPALLRRGELRTSVEAAQALADRLRRTKQRANELVAKRPGAWREDELGLDSAAIDGKAYEVQLPALDAEIERVARQIRALANALERAVEGVQELRPADGADAVAATAKRLDAANGELAELEARAAELRAERDRLAAVVAWGEKQTRPLSQPSEFEPVA
jgi:DNA repair protein SbcC/Rad50